jgi:hypothetical protein
MGKEYQHRIVICIGLGLLTLLSAIPGNAQSRPLLPFFDDIDNPVRVKFPSDKAVDVTPPAPELTPFDRAVLRACGPVGTRVQPIAFRNLLSYYPDVVRKLQAVTDGELIKGRTTDAEFIDDLTAAWFDREGFEHIFCGELDGPKKIGGLHFYGRYLQFQQEGIGGRLPNNSRKEEVVPGVIYTLGVVIRRGDRTFTDDLKGYPYPTNALEMLLETTRLYKLQGSTQGACIAKITDQPTGKTYDAVFVKDRRAIVTFYPDATPNGKPCRSDEAAGTR